jgi:hypothetical protein
VSRWILRLLCLAVVCPFAKADAQYYKHTLFDNSLEPDAYYYSSGRASLPSTLRTRPREASVSRDVFYTPPNALRLKWRSVPDGGWEAGISAINFRNREINFQGDTPLLLVLLGRGYFGQRLTPRPASSRILMTTFRFRFRWESSFQIWRRKMGSSSNSFGGIQDWLDSRIATPPGEQGRPLSRTKAIPQSTPLIVDEFMIDDRAVVSSGLPGMASILPAPQNVHAKGYERHIDITWDAMNSPHTRALCRVSLAG